MAREFTPWEKWQSYMRGWSHGCGMRPMDERFTGHELAVEFYNRGYEDGQRLRRLVSAHAANEFGYEPEVLRDAGTTATAKKGGTE